MGIAVAIIGTELRQHSSHNGFSGFQGVILKIIGTGIFCYKNALSDKMSCENLVLIYQAISDAFTVIANVATIYSVICAIYWTWVGEWVFITNCEFGTNLVA